MTTQNQTFGIAAKALIIKGDKLLVLYKSKEEAKEWTDFEAANLEARRDLPGGRLEFGEGPKSALVREVREETGLEVELVKPLDVWHMIKGNFQLVGINYLCRCLAGDVVLSHEHEAHEWLSESELLAKEWDDVVRYVVAFENE